MKVLVFFSSIKKINISRIKFLLLFLICISSVLISYFLFYIVRLKGDKPRIGQLVASTQPFPHEILDNSLISKWTLLIARPAKDCYFDNRNNACILDLYTIHQLRLAMGKEMSRVRILWLVTDNYPIDPKVLNIYNKPASGFYYLKLPKDNIKKQKILIWLNQNEKQYDIQLIDPKGNRMMYFNISSQPLEFQKIKKDLETLLKWNSIGKR